MRTKPSIIIYNDFLKDYQKINAWTISDSFPIEDIEENEEMKKYAVIEIIYTGTHGDNSKYDNIRKVFESFLSRYLQSINNEKLLFNISETGVRNRIRSYKGLFKEKEYCIEEEFDIDDRYSIIGGIAKINGTSMVLTKSHLFDRTKSFLILSENNFFSRDFLIDCFKSVINETSYTINYAKACRKYCENNIIIRESGDGGDQEFSWQIFTNKKHTISILDRINKIVNNM